MGETSAGRDGWRDALARRIDTVALRPDLAQRASLVLVDDLAAGLAGARAPEVAALMATAAARTGPGESSLLTGARLGRERAAAINAVAMAWEELDEGYRPATCHGGLYTVPSVLAEAEATDLSLGDVLTAVLVGYEVVTVLARRFPPQRPLRQHPHATLSPVGAAASLGWLRGRSGAATLDAADVAASMAMAGPFSYAGLGAQVRNAWAGAGALVGFFAADVAAAGLGSPPSASTDVYRDVFGYDTAPAEHTDPSDPSQPWAILDGYHKVYAACQYTHSGIEAALTLAGRDVRDRGTETIAEIVVRTHPLAVPLDEISPRTTLAGKFSVPHTVAAVLSSGSAASNVFGEEGLRDPVVDRLRRLVRIEPFTPLAAAPHDRPSSVELVFDDGTRAEQTCLSAVGGPDRPLSTGQVLDKVEALAQGHAPGFGDTARALVAGEVGPATPWREVLESAGLR